MKYYLKSIANIKKEAKSIKKIFDTHLPDNNFKLHEYQDLVSSFYGWKNFNEASLGHNRERNTDKKLSSESYINRQDYINKNIKEIGNINDDERRVLEENKRKQTKLLLASLSSTPPNKDVIISEAFDKSSKINFITSFLSKGDIKNINDIPEDIKRSGFCVFGDDINKKSKIINEIHIPRSINTGGVMILEEGLYDNVIEHAISSYELTGTPYIALNHTSLKTTSLISDSYSLYGKTNLEEVKLVVQAQLMNESQSVNFWLSYITFLADKYPEQNKSLNSEWGDMYHSDYGIINIENFVDNHLLPLVGNSILIDNISEASSSKFDIINRIRNLGFNDKAYRDGIKQPSTFYHNVSIVMKHITNAISNIQSNTINKTRKSIQEVMENKGVVILGIPSLDYSVENKEAKSIFNIFRQHMLNNITSLMIGRFNNASNQDKVRDDDAYPVYLDNVDTYSMPGMGVLLAQYSEANTSCWVGFCKSDVSNRDTKELEKIKSNLSNSIYLSSDLSNELSKKIQSNYVSENYGFKSQSNDEEKDHYASHLNSLLKTDDYLKSINENNLLILLNSVERYNELVLV